MGSGVNGKTEPLVTSQRNLKVTKELFHSIKAGVNLNFLQNIKNYFILEMKSSML